jgi:hypothetical protein
VLNPSGRLPSFYVIGAMKSGTSSLNRAVASHPSVFVSTPKELHFFVEDRNWSRGVEWYAEQFAAANGATAVGEASATYAQMPFRAGVPERMSALTPDARIVYLVRNPIERMLSHYRYNLGRGRETRPLMAAFEHRGNYRAFSQYAMQLRYYLDYFPREQLLVLPAEWFFGDIDAAVRRVWAHIGVDGAGIDVTPTHVNATATLTAPVGAVRTLRNLKAAQVALKALPTSARKRLKAGMPQKAVGSQHIELTASDRARLEDEFREEVAGIAPYVEGPFDGWGLA